MPMEGIFKLKASDLAVEEPIKRGPLKPGPAVYAIAFRSFNPNLTSSKVSLISGMILIK